MKNFKFMEKIILSLSSINVPPLLILGLKFVFFVLGVVLLAMIAFIVLRTNWLRYRYLEDIVGFFSYRPMGMGKLIKQWNKIIERLESGSEDEYKVAILEAEEMLDNILKRLNYPGDTLKERLDKLSPVTISDKRGVEVACETRNKIVYDPNYRLSLDEAKETLDYFGQALKDLQVF